MSHAHTHPYPCSVVVFGAPPCVFVDLGNPALLLHLLVHKVALMSSCHVLVLIRFLPLPTPSTPLSLSFPFPLAGIYRTGT